MKSREEYQASIFAKRDALLRKRKRNITKAVTGTAAAIVLTVSLIAVPEITAKLPLDSEQTIPDITTTQAVFKEENITQQHPDYDSYPESEDAAESSAETSSATYSYYITSDETAADAFAGSVDEATPKSTNIAIQSAESTTAEPDDSNIDSAETAGENESVEPDDTDYESTKSADTGNDYAAETGGDDTAETDIDSVAPEAADSSDDFTQEEIISAAITYLPDDAKKLADPENAFVTVTRTSEGEEYYEVRFDINGSKHKITLDGDTLEFVSAESTNGSTSEQPQIQTSPPYNPNS